MMREKRKLSDAERQEAGKVFTEVWTRFFPELEKRFRRYPREISHYTTAKGLLGICRSNAIWATCAQYSNDSSEATYGAEITKALFPNLDPPERSALGVSLAVIVGKPLFAPQNVREYGSLDAFTASFCKSKDLLSQWRGYGPKLGFEIRFSGMTVGNSRSAKDVVSLRSDAMLVELWSKVEYDPTAQRKMIAEIMSGIESVRKELARISHDHRFRATIESRESLLSAFA